MTSERPIATSYNPLCISPAHDWTAWYDDVGADSSPYGYGHTEDEAIADLREQEEDVEK